jgi:hypothetical protein
MNADEFLRKRARIASEHSTSSRRYKSEMERLVRDADAALVVMNRKIIGYRLKTGEIVCVKERYRDEADARAALADIARSNLEGARIPVRSYYCTRCKGFHVTSQRFEKSRYE